MNGRELYRLLTEALIVVLSGLVFALTANLISPCGLTISRNYFPKAAIAKVDASDVAPVAESSPIVVPVNASEPNPTLDRLKGKGLQGVGVEEVWSLYQDPQYEQELIVFVDARNDQHYQEGHIPGAYQFDHYYPDRYFPAVLPACLNALQVIVYCSGGACEDSEFTALTLQEAGIPQERLFVYTGGITEWIQKGLPIETGPRKSGILRQQTP